jgi:hypothetical protein
VPANHKVSVAWQIVFTFISIVNLWAFYRIRKLRKYLLYVFVPSLVISSILVGGYFVNNMPGFHPSPDHYDNPDWFTAYALGLSYAISAAFQAFGIYLIIIWSRQHNRQFDQSETQTPPKT